MMKSELNTGTRSTTPRPGKENSYGSRVLKDASCVGKMKVLKVARSAALT